MAFARALLLIALSTLACGCALNENEGDREAGAAVKSVIEREYVGDYRSVWEELHPRHQRFVTREEYEDCRRGIDVEGTLQSVLILGVRDQPLTIFGLPPRTQSKAVRVRVTTDEGAYSATYHVVVVDGTWRWVLSDGAARGFARTDCPS
jgi:hypothetical protein